jgi:peptidoglycan/xylan/chitin deacetylase (PgdA/CDA1 family)
LTFDDGPYIYLNDVVSQLDAAGVKGTFFFNGNNYDCIYNPDAMARVKLAYSHGHMIGSHTWAHLDLATLSWDRIHDEMWRVEQAVQRITGAYVAFMRPPYGSYNQQVLDASGIRGQGVVIWDFDSQDSVGASPDQSKGYYDNIVNQHPNTILALNHETIETTVHQVLPYAIQRLQAAGYRLVTVAECLGMPAYQSVGNPGTPDGSWTC